MTALSWVALLASAGMVVFAVWLIRTALRGWRDGP